MDGGSSTRNLLESGERVRMLARMNKILTLLIATLMCAVASNASAQLNPPPFPVPQPSLDDASAAAYCGQGQPPPPGHHWCWGGPLMDRITVCMNQYREDLQDTYDGWQRIWDRYTNLISASQSNVDTYCTPGPSYNAALCLHWKAKRTQLQDFQQELHQGIENAYSMDAQDFFGCMADFCCRLCDGPADPGDATARCEGDDEAFVAASAIVLAGLTL